jgi:hypothetical protein
VAKRGGDVGGENAGQREMTHRSLNPSDREFYAEMERRWLFLAYMLRRSRAFCSSSSAA